MLVPEHTDLKVPESRLFSCHCSKCSSFFNSGTKAEQLTQGSANVSPDTSDHGGAQCELRLAQNSDPS